jgi:protein-S-isoprenylcysteine O-methyltransferase Ste14
MLRSLAKLLMGLAIFVGLPLAAWGFRDLSQFFRHPARLAYVILAVLLQLAVILGRPGSGEGGPGRPDAKRGNLDLILIQIISLAIVLAGPYTDRSSLASMAAPDCLRFIGLALFALGMLLMQWAEAALGRQFSVKLTLQEGHRLVTSGPYNILRHPRYAGILLFFAGFSLAFRSWLALALVGAMAALLLYRIRAEEAMMRQEFGSEWESYAKRSWRMVPWMF